MKLSQKWHLKHEKQREQYKIFMTKLRDLEGDHPDSFNWWLHKQKSNILIAWTVGAVVATMLGWHSGLE